MNAPTLLASMILALLAIGSQAAEAPRRDPWVPPEKRIRSMTPPSHGAALQAEVTDKLRRRFAAADGSNHGSITRDQAQRAGFGYVANAFDAIDTRRSGSVTFAEVQQYIERRKLAQ
ncbi:MAG: EF-hand domain-containing protein [Burkholderiales bacterium]|nr:EF-hand domain-containing protein [Burkholderiales bacterium]